MTTHSSILAQKIPWMSLVDLSPQDHRVRHNRATEHIYINIPINVVHCPQSSLSVMWYLFSAITALVPHQGA